MKVGLGFVATAHCHVTRMFVGVISNLQVEGLQLRGQFFVDAKTDWTLLGGKSASNNCCEHLSLINNKF